MARSMTLLKALQVEVDENGEGSWVKFESFVTFLKHNHHPADSIVGIKTSNVRKEINGHRYGLKQIHGTEYVSFSSILKYVFHHCDQISICRRICDQTVQCILGNTDSASNVFEIYKAVAHTQLHSKQIEATVFNLDTETKEGDIPTLYKDYKINFTKEEWRRIVEFEFHFGQMYGSSLNKTSFDEQINLRWTFLKELQETVSLSSLIQSQTKFTVAQRSKRKQVYEYTKTPDIVSSLRHKPSVLDVELLKCLQNMSVTNVISVDCTRKCTHDYSIHLFIVMEYEDLSNIDTSLIIQSVRCHLDK